MYRSSITPKVSVVIPFYNGLGWLIEAVESVFNQTYQNFEVIIVNDGSKESIEHLVNQYKDRLKIFSQLNGGAASARNKGIEEARGDYIAFLDSDDFWHPQKLEFQVRIMEDKGIVWSHHSYFKYWDRGDLKLVDTSAHIGSILNDIFVSFRVQTSTVIVRRQFLLDENIRFSTSFKWGQDVDFYIELGLRANLYHVASSIGYFRMREDSTGFNPKIQVIAKNKIWKKWKDNILISEQQTLLTKLSYRYCNFLCKWLYKEDLFVTRKGAKFVDYILYSPAYIMLHMQRLF